MSYSSNASADDDDDGYRYSQPGGYYREEIIYYPQPQVQYYSPPPQVNYYYPQPPVNYYPPNPRPNAYYDQRSSQGLMGGVVGSVLVYEFGNGNPIVPDQVQQLVLIWGVDGKDVYASNRYDQQ